MKTLDYIQLDKQKVENVINGLQQLLADFQVYYTNLRGSTGTSKVILFLFYIANLKICIIVPLKQLMRLQKEY